jgi:hypothetical protein
LASDLSAPGAKQRSVAANQALDSLVSLILKQEGSKLKVAGVPAAGAKAGGAQQQSSSQILAPGAKATRGAK